MSQVSPYRQMVRGLAKPGAAIRASLDKFDALGFSGYHLVHMGGCLQAEVSEMIVAVKRGDKPNITEEGGDKSFFGDSILDFTSMDIRTDGISPGLDGEFTALEKLQIVAGEIWDLIMRPTLRGKFPKDSNGQEMSREEWTAKLGDRILMFHVHLAAVVAPYGLTLQDLRDHNQAKLATGPNARFAKGYSDEANFERADKAAEGETPGV
jgi:hypothetical protein